MHCHLKSPNFQLERTSVWMGRTWSLSWGAMLVEPQPFLIPTPRKNLKQFKKKKIIAKFRFWSWNLENPTHITGLKKVSNDQLKIFVFLINFEIDQPWWLSGLICHNSNSSRDRRSWVQIPLKALYDTVTYCYCTMNVT